MPVNKDIFQILDEANNKAPVDSGGTTSETPDSFSTNYGSPKKKSGIPGKEERELKIVGYPVSYLNWDDIGLGTVRTMGYIPTKAVVVEFKKGEWTIAGSYARSSVLWFILAGAGGLTYFLQDLIAQVKDWGWIASTLFFIIPTLANLFVRNRVLKYKPYEIEMLAFDSVSNILVLSSLTEPGGALALKLEFSKSKRMEIIEKEQLKLNLQKVHSGFTNIDGLAKTNVTMLQGWSIQAFLWIVVIWLYYEYFM